MDRITDLKQLGVLVHMINEPELTECYKKYIDVQLTADIFDKLAMFNPDIVSTVETDTGISNDQFQYEIACYRKTLECLIARYFKKKVEDGSIMDSIN